MAQARDQLHGMFPGRAKQIDQILSFMGQPCSPTPPSLLVNGNSSVGKTAVVKNILATTLGHHSPSRYAFIDCVECHTPRLIFEHAIYQFRSAPKGTRPRIHAPPTEDESATHPSATSQSSGSTKKDTRKRKRPASSSSHVDTSWEKCENVNEFVEWCRRICDQDDIDTAEDQEMAGSQEQTNDQRIKGGKDTRYLVLDRAERLRDTAPTLIPVLMRLQELTGRNICVILITTIVWEKFRSKTGGYEPIILHFPQYSKSETVAILERDLPEGEDAELYMRFVDLVYDVFQRNCKDLNEIRHLVALLFPLYVKPVKEGKIQRHEGLKLHRHIQAYFVEAMDKIYLREISSMEWSDRTTQAAGGSLHSRTDGDSSSSRMVSGAPGSERAMMTAVSVQNVFDLPYFTKFILIAAFLASYNPPRLDMRYFAKVSNQGGKMTKRAKVAAAKRHGHDSLGSKLRQQLLGPKTFPIERMLAIFYSILDEEAEETVHVHTQIASLVSLRLLQRVTPMDKLDSIKCKCNVSYETIKALAKSTKFDIDKYLYDFT
ncbi:origin recognition complex subunit 5 [Entomortierella parvispora]|uniref:Origin recognition complex subunit 5 n=1 Tax=Entomortierella parvispora TaxID=205924 RepID=A0A9P3H1S2_9FUNG|nr:origin recognition complex subunit 5 [Entomortierella parvispora]